MKFILYSRWRHYMETLYALCERSPPIAYNATQKTTMWCEEQGRMKSTCIQYIPRNMHTVFALLCFVVVIHWLIFTYLSGLLHWHCGNLTIAPVPAKQPWWIWINTSCEFIMTYCITTTKQSTTIPCAYLLGYTVCLEVDMVYYVACSARYTLRQVIMICNRTIIEMKRIDVNFHWRMLPLS